MTTLNSPIEEIKSKLDLVEVIQEYVPLKKVGANFKALCPFHAEKTPSFIVSPEKQIWHCFGCNLGGDIFGFVMQIEGVEFPEALRILAQKAGVVLRKRDPALENQKTRLLDVCRLAADFYHHILLDSSQAEKARSYLKKREISQETIEDFKLGYAPEGWENLSLILRKKGLKENDIFLAGLTVKKERGTGFYDRFRDRLIFPLMDVHGNIVGFGGRTLKKEEEGAKYINSPQTLIYNKSQILFALDKAKTHIKKKKTAVVVEGYMDVLASFQTGVKNVVASGGTALTLEQVKLLKRFTSTLAFAFDMDAAGSEASKRGIEVALKEGVEVKIIILPFGKDPDECIKKDPEAWREAIQKSQSIMDYYFTDTFSKLDISRVEDKKKAAKIILHIISQIPDPIEQTHWLQKLAEKIKVEEKILREVLTKSYQEKPVKKEEETSHLKRLKKEHLLGEIVLGIALKYPQYLDYLIDHLKPEDISIFDLRDIYQELILYYTKKHKLDFEEFNQIIREKNKKLSNYLNLLLIKTEDSLADFKEDELKLVLKEELATGIFLLRKENILQALKRVESQLKRIEGKKDDQEEEKKLLEKFEKLTQELQGLKKE